MSRHSKWSKIKHKKGVVDVKRGNVFTKLCRAITIAAQHGGDDPGMNFSLRLAIEKARAANVPKENIDRAIKRGTGEMKDEAVLAEVMYEGFGPGGAAMLIETVTDNRTRTVAEVKNIVSKRGGTVGSPGSVQWQFARKAAVRFAQEKKQAAKDWETVELALMDAGAEDIRESDDGVEIVGSVPSLQRVMETLHTYSIEPDDSALEWVAKDMVPLAPEAREQLDALMDDLYALDDVREIYTNI